MKKKVDVKELNTHQCHPAKYFSLSLSLLSPSLLSLSLLSLSLLSLASLSASRTNHFLSSPLSSLRLRLLFFSSYLSHSLSLLLSFLLSLIFFEHFTTLYVCLLYPFPLTLSSSLTLTLTYSFLLLSIPTGLINKERTSTNSTSQHARDRQEIILSLSHSLSLCLFL